MLQAIVVGAGISGLIAARRLQKAGWTVRLLEKSQSLGGRMATRHVDNAVFDHGAQYFTMHSMFFRSLVEDLQDQGLVKGWCRGFLNTDRQLILDGYQRFYAPQGMRSIAEFIAEPLQIQTGVSVTQLSQQTHSWHLNTSSGETYEADALVLSAPLPQSLSLLEKAENFKLSEKQQTQLQSIKYNPCIALMATLDGPSGLPETGAIRIEDPMSPLLWIADNIQKGISETPGVTIHGTPHFSRKHWKLPREEAGTLLWEAAKAYLSANAIDQQTHGWRFAQAQSVMDVQSFTVDSSVPLVLAGDAFGDLNNPIEGAVLSGLDAAQQLIRTHK